MKKETRGGFRPNAKRPLKGENKRLPFSCRISTESKTAIETIASEKKISQGEVIDLLLKNYTEACPPLKGAGG